MRDREKRTLDRLLGGSPGPSIQERESMLGAVLSRSRRRGSWRRFRWPVLVPAMVAATAGFLAWGLLLQDRQGREQGEFSSRGGASRGALLRVSCASQGKASLSEVVCRPGETLAIAVRPPPGKPHVAAVALGPDGLLVSYFPSPELASPRVPEGSTLERGVILGPEHVAGAYQLVIFFSERRLGETEVQVMVERRATGDARVAASASAAFRVLP